MSRRRARLRAAAAEVAHRGVERDRRAREQKRHGRTVPDARFAAMTDRARYLGFAACLGAGLALLIYRFAVLGFMWDGPAKNVLQIGAPVLIVVGSQLVRGVQDKTKPWLLMIVTAVVGGSVAWGVCTQAVPGLARARLAQRELPGFSIGLPSGKTTD